MAHITTEEVADIRARLKEAFPASDGWKFSVRRCRTGLSVSVDVMSGPHTFTAYDYDAYAHDDSTPRSAAQAAAMGSVKVEVESTVNHYWIEDHWTPESAAILKKIYGIIARDHWDHSDSMSDYFHCAFYIHMGIGQWGKPYKDVSPPAMAQAA
jgi:hypothetical protein